MTPFIAMEFAYVNGKKEEEGTERNKKMVYSLFATSE